MTHPDCEGCRKALEEIRDNGCGGDCDGRCIRLAEEALSTAPAKPCAEVTLTEKEKAALKFYGPKAEDFQCDDCGDAGEGQVLAALLTRLMGQGETK